ncbi:MAG: uncharacterized membrane protein (DUF2068 family) [Paraglaciecola sp.]|jgi:uncharacterized membrane protein (DUF2068 family)
MSNIHKGLKIVALFEGAKGLLSLVVGFGIHELSGQNVQQILERGINHLHLNPASHLPNLMIQEAHRLTYSNLSLIALGALVYSIIRLVEAYGLWRGLLWTEWFALVSGAIYLPFELYELVVHRNILSVLVLLVNVAIVWYMYSILQVRRLKTNKNVLL